MKRRSNLEPQAYKRTGLLAVHPQAFLELFMVPESRENEERDGVVIVDICGPLTQHDDGWCDSYEAIKGRVQAACESAATAIVLRVDSPGGDVAGCFDTARAIRAMCEAAEKPLWAYADKACSAGYALAAAANRVCVAATSIVGSVGVVNAREDISAMLAARGIRVSFIASGARKADGNPEAPLTEGELKATQALIDSMAGVFFELIAELRGVPAASVEALQAGVFHGDAAVKARLADAVVSFDEMLAAVASGKGLVMSSSYEKAKAALEEAAAGDDANAAAAKRALAAMEEPKTEPDGDEPPKDDKKDSAEGEPAKTDDDKDDDKPPAAAATGKAAASTADIALQALTEVNQLKAQLKSEKLKTERDALLASRPDIPADLLPVLRAASLSTVRDYIAGLPKASAAKSAAKPAATAVVAATRGAGQGGPDVTPPAAPIDDMDRAMGMTTLKLGARRDGNVMVFGMTEVPTHDTAARTGGAK
jgi:ClpP class serine protease